MRIFVNNPNATMVCFGENQYPVKGQVADVPDEVGASVLTFDGYEQFTGQVDLHKDFVKADKEAADKAAKEAAKAAGTNGTPPQGPPEDPPTDPNSGGAPTV